MTSLRDLEEHVISEGYRVSGAGWPAVVACLIRGLRWALARAYAKGYAAGRKGR